MDDDDGKDDDGTVVDDGTDGRTENDDGADGTDTTERSERCLCDLKFELKVAQRLNGSDPRHRSKR